jgi:hypothetical protein
MASPPKLENSVFEHLETFALYLKNFTTFDNQKGSFAVIVFVVNVEHFWKRNEFII